jgi:YYY domain-containing protein
MGVQGTLPGRMLAALGLFVLVEVVGLLAAPLAALVLGRLPGAGLGFAKVLGLLLVTWFVWIAGSLGIAAYGTPLIAGVLVLLAICGVLVALRLRALGARLEAAGSRRRVARLARLALPADDPVRRRLFWGAEGVFAVTFAAGVLLASLAPDVWNTEKPMDMAFMTALNASDSFPPHDPWMSGETLNYYYLGHLVFAWPMQLLGLRPDTGYLLSWGLLIALTATTVFTFAGTLWAAGREALAERAPRGGPVAAGLVAAALVVVLGNLAGVRTWIRAADPPGDYAWFDPSRVIPDTINEFPSFSFLLGDLHAHVLALPFTVLALAFAMQVALHGPRGDLLWRSVAEAFAAALAVGALWAINSWSYPVAAGLLVAAVVVYLRGGGAVGYPLVWLGLVLIGGLVLMLPFVLDFDPEARGVGIVRTRREFPEWLGDMALIYGILIWPLIPAFFSRWMGSPNRWIWLGMGGVACLVVGVMLEAGGELAGTMVVALATAVGIAAALSPALSAAERFLWVLIAGGAVLLVIPELVYLRDAFDGGELFRMNTVFKAGFQAFLLLGLAAACALPWSAVWLSRRAWTGWAAVAAVLLLLGLVYPYAGSYARTGGFANTPSLNGLKWLESRSPGDPGAIEWLRENAAGDAVVLEAFGDDYSAFGHARISTFSGRPTVMGWEGHEVQWQHEPGARKTDIQTLYTTTNAATARELIDRYGIRYVVAGPIEQTTYGDAGLAKWDTLGERVYDEGGTAIWRLD